jgi:hypothetical protein
MRAFGAGWFILAIIRLFVGFDFVWIAFLPFRHLFNDFVFVFFVVFLRGLVITFFTIILQPILGTTLLSKSSKSFCLFAFGTYFHYEALYSSSADYSKSIFEKYTWIDVHGIFENIGKKGSWKMKFNTPRSL